MIGLGGGDHVFNFPARVFQFWREVEIADKTKNSAVGRTAINGD